MGKFIELCINFPFMKLWPLDSKFIWASYGEGIGGPGSKSFGAGRVSVNIALDVPKTKARSPEGNAELRCASCHGCDKSLCQAPNPSATMASIVHCSALVAMPDAICSCTPHSSCPTSTVDHRTQLPVLYKTN
jgi:hypothetical protein